MTSTMLERVMVLGFAIWESFWSGWGQIQTAMHVVSLLNEFGVCGPATSPSLAKPHQSPGIPGRRTSGPFLFVQTVSVRWVLSVWPAVQTFKPCTTARVSSGCGKCVAPCGRETVRLIFPMSLALLYYIMPQSCWCQQSNAHCHLWTHRDFPTTRGSY